MAGLGGKRAGAGRKKGSKNKITEARESIAFAALHAGVTPLEYMLDCMRMPIPEDADAITRAAMVDLRFEAAKAAAPYVHPRLTAAQIEQGKPGSFDKSAPDAKQSARERVREKIVKLGLAKMDETNVVPIKKRA